MLWSSGLRLTISVMWWVVNTAWEHMLLSAPKIETLCSPSTLVTTDQTARYRKLGDHTIPICNLSIR
jgi:hypothetical protein